MKRAGQDDGADADAPPPSKRPAPAPPMTLTEDRAFAVLLAASAPLKGRLRLVAREGVCEVVGSYEWIEIDVPDPAEKPMKSFAKSLAWVEQARDVCVLWHMVASCPRFGGYENPTFWKRLIDQIADDVEDYVPDSYGWEWDSTLSTRRDVAQVTDAYKFFLDRHGYEDWFPRFRLVLPNSAWLDSSRRTSRVRGKRERYSTTQWFDEVVRTFIGLDDGRGRCSGLIRSALPQLHPFVDLDRFNSRVELGVRLTKLYTLEGLAETICSIEEDLRGRQTAEPTSRWNALVNAAQLCFPRVLLNELCISTLEPVESDTDLDILTEILRTQLVRVPYVELKPTANISMASLTMFMKTVAFKRPRNRVARTHLFLQMVDASVPQVEAIFSMLAQSFGGCVGTLTVSNRDEGMDYSSLNECKWTWLSYLLHHPGFNKSPVLYLDLRELDPRESSATSFLNAGNAQDSMYRLLHGSSPTNVVQAEVCHTSVLLQSGTQVDRSKSLEGSTMWTTHSAWDYTAVIDRSVESIEDLPDAVCVIIPGHGHGWISKTAVLEIKRERVTKPRLYGLRLGSWHEGEMQALLSSARIFISGASRLDISAFGTLDAQQLLAVLSECSDLTHLIVKHNGELFSQWAELTSGTESLVGQLTLEGLSLLDVTSYHAPSPDAWRTCLRKIREFVLCNNIFRVAPAAIVSETLHAGHSIEYFVWRNGSVNSSYIDGQATAREVLGLAAWEPRAQQSFSYDGHIALLSVIKRAQGVSAMGQLQEHIVQLIGEHSTTAVPRSVWVGKGLSVGR